MWDRERPSRRPVARHAARIAKFTAGASLTILAVALLLPADDERCLSWKERWIAYTDTTPARLHSLRAQTPVHEAPGLASLGLLPGDFGGVALPDRIIISLRRNSGMTHTDKEHLIWHEIVHVEQMRQDGLGAFLLRYVTDWMRGRWHGCGMLDAYEAIRYEREADLYASGMELVDWMRRSGSTSTLPSTNTGHSGSIRTGASGNPRAGYSDALPMSVIAEHLVAAGFP